MNVILGFILNYDYRKFLQPVLIKGSSSHLVEKKNANIAWSKKRKQNSIVLSLTMHLPLLSQTTLDVSKFVVFDENRLLSLRKNERIQGHTKKKKKKSPQKNAIYKKGFQLIKMLPRESHLGSNFQRVLLKTSKNSLVPFTPNTSNIPSKFLVSIVI